MKQSVSAGSDQRKVGRVPIGMDAVDFESKGAETQFEQIEVDPGEAARTIRQVALHRRVSVHYRLHKRLGGDDDS